LQSTHHFWIHGWNLVSIVTFSYQPSYRCSPWLFNYFFPNITYQPFGNFFTELTLLHNRCALTIAKPKSFFHHFTDFLWNK
jgi:hypothetical protein